MESAQEFAQITELSKHVAEWEDKVTPQLEAEETRGPFDIYDYGTGVMDNLHGDVVISFKSLVQGKPSFEICRTFLASLMLVRQLTVLYAI